MNTRSGLFTFLLFLLLLAMIVLQVLSMVQSDRLYERLNLLLENISGRQFSPSRTEANPNAQTQDKYPGDEGDWLVVRMEDEPRTLNSIVESSGYGSQVMTRNIFEGLLDLDLDSSDLKLKPLLAESYEMSKDGLQITFRLRDNIHFSDGHPITADDIIFTYETIMNPGVDAAHLANYYRDIKRVEKINEREVRFIMSRVYFKSLEFACLRDVGILPKHIYDFNDPSEFNKHRSNPVGSGPYVFEKWNVGQEIVLRRNENYWGQKPKLKKIVYRIITNDKAAVQALRAGEVDYVYRPLPAQFTELCRDETFTREFKCLSYWNPSVGYFWIGWNEDRPFFADRNVRLAMTYLVDRESIRKHILRNPDAQIPTGPFYIYGRQNDPNIKPWPYDPEKAKQLLDEAGWIDHDGDGIRDKNGVVFRFKYMIVSGLDIHEQIAKLLKDEAAKVGIDVILDPYEGTVFFERAQNRTFDAISMAWGGGLAGDPYQVWHSSQIGNRGSNYVGFRNSEADALIEEARQTLDADKRNMLYRRFHQIIHEEQPYTFVYTRPVQEWLDRRFENVIMHKLGLDSIEWYVPKDKQRYK
jgi:peptide/nickel transport system substrate-binding protein